MQQRVKLNFLIYGKFQLKASVFFTGIILLVTRLVPYPCTKVRSLISHCHESDASKTAGMILREEIIASANANRAQPGQILADKLIQHFVEVI
ncbi:hypothetical protein DPMN_177765 [Dreissena polymorpha]|uniref:Uncharacterized protein n=1 Tax=Dreissena polymorpha TaxID=45954 RepID=A0A9D4ILY5_DREPO|nr:hypothetical protein DPMN_177765 [Dreissena polymorpha]